MCDAPDACARTPRPDKLPADQQAEYGVGKGATVKGVGRLHSGWPNVKGVLKASTNTDPYAEDADAD